MKTLGLDLGTNSVGWAWVVKHEHVDKPEIDAGVFVFPEAGELESGLYVSHRRKRGMKRRQRRNIARSAQRRHALRNLLTDYGLLPQDSDELQQLMCDHYAVDGTEVHPYALRVRALDGPITLHEFGRVLYHLCRRRGYLSNAILKLRPKGMPIEQDKHTADLAIEGEELPEEPGGKPKRDKEESVLLKRMSFVRAAIQKGEARTLGEYYAKALARGQGVRGMSETRIKKVQERDPNFQRDPLGLRADRLLFEDEFFALWDAQQVHHPAVLTADLKYQLIRAIFRQRPLKPATHLIGKCGFYPHRRRAARASLLAQRVVILQDLAHLTLQEEQGAPWIPLTSERIAVLASALDLEDFISWKAAKQMLYLSDKARFSLEPGGKRGAAGGEQRAKKHLTGNRTAAAMRRAIGEKWSVQPESLQEDLITRLITCRNVRDLQSGLKRDFGLDEQDIGRLAAMELPDGQVNHCSRALREIEPWLRQGFVYSEACEKAGLRDPNTSTEAPVEIVDKLPNITGVNNPIVERSVNMAIRVINTVVRKYGKPDRIHVELPRDVAKTNHQREEDWKRQDKRGKEREAAAKKLTENGMSTSKRSIDKVLLWEEAGCRSPYEPDVAVSITQLDEYDIDHIVPRSRCWNDSFANLTIAPFSLNAQKSNKTPFETWGRSQQWEKVVSYLRSCHSLPQNKKVRIQNEEWDEQEFTNRALTETSYISRLILKHVKQLGVDVVPSRGQLTGLLRSSWQLGEVIPIADEQKEKIKAWQEKSVKKNPKPRFDHRHHALDAVLVALTDRSTLQLLTGHLKRVESRNEKREDIPKPLPWLSIATDLMALMERTLVVHAPTRGISGSLHKETAQKPPPRAEVDAAIAALSAEERSRINRCVVVGNQLVYFGDTGEPTKAYDLGNNHHAVIWERGNPRKFGQSERSLDVVTMMEASRRAQSGQPVIQTTRPGWNYVMSFCKNDIICWNGDSPQLMRIAKFSKSREKKIEIVFRPLIDSTADKTTQLPIWSEGHLIKCICRVSLNSIGSVIATEPPGITIDVLQNSGGRQSG